MVKSSVFVGGALGINSRTEDFEQHTAVRPFEKISVWQKGESGQS